MFEGQQELGAIAQDQIDIVTVKLNDKIGSFKIRTALVAGFQFEPEIQMRIGNDLAEKFFDPRTGFLNRIFGLQLFFLPSLTIIAPFIFASFIFASMVTPDNAVPGTAGAVLLKNHCSATPTKLLVR